MAAIRLRFELDTDATEEQLDTLIRLTERFLCGVADDPNIARHRCQPILDLSIPWLAGYLSLDRSDGRRSQNCRSALPSDEPGSPGTLRSQLGLPGSPEAVR